MASDDVRPLLAERRLLAQLIVRRDADAETLMMLSRTVPVLPSLLTTELLVYDVACVRTLEVWGGSILAWVASGIVAVLVHTGLHNASLQAKQEANTLRGEFHTLCQRAPAGRPNGVLAKVSKVLRRWPNR